jgi:cell division protein FtsQ
MDIAEFEQRLHDAEVRLARLKALYEQWFQGIERIEPQIARKELERSLELLKREQPRNTALRFRCQQLSARYGTYGIYWGRIAKQIEEGTYRRDLQRARAAIEAVPWVRRAVVRREFPNRLRVTLEEHQPVALWGNEGDARMVNQQGELFEANVAEADVERMPRLIGPDAQSAEVLGLYRLLSPMFGQLRFELSSLELTARGSWRAHLEGGSVVELGRGQAPQVQERVQRLTQTLTQVASRYGRRVSAMESADLRHENGYALRLRGVSTLENQGLKR